MTQPLTIAPVVNAIASYLEVRWDDGWGQVEVGEIARFIANQFNPGPVPDSPIRWTMWFHSGDMEEDPLRGSTHDKGCTRALDCGIILHSCRICPKVATEDGKLGTHRSSPLAGLLTGSFFDSLLEGSAPLSGLQLSNYSWCEASGSQSVDIFGMIDARSDQECPPDAIRSSRGGISSMDPCEW